MYPMENRSRTAWSRIRISLRILWYMVRELISVIGETLQASSLHSVYYTFADINDAECSLAASYNTFTLYSVLLTAMSHLFDDDNGYHSDGSTSTEDLDPKIAAERRQEAKV